MCVFNKFFVSRMCTDNDLGIPYIRKQKYNRKDPVLLLMFNRRKEDSLFRGLTENIPFEFRFTCKTRCCSRLENTNNFLFNCIYQSAFQLRKIDLTPNDLYNEYKKKTHPSDIAQNKLLNSRFQRRQQTFRGALTTQT